LKNIGAANKAPATDNTNVTAAEEEKKEEAVTVSSEVINSSTKPVVAEEEKKQSESAQPNIRYITDIEPTTLE